MKTKIVLSLIFLLISCSIVFAQTDHNNGLVLTGKINVKSRNDRDYKYISGNLRMELTNTGKEPIILINPNLEFGKLQRKINFSGFSYDPKHMFRKSKISFSVDVQRSNPEELNELAKNLDVEKPPQNLTYILDPGDSIQFVDNLEVKIEKKIQLSWQDSTIEYKVSLVKYHPDPDLLEKLQSRWRKYGYLPVDKNGDFSISFEYPNK